MTLRERAARAGFQIFLESDSTRFVGKFQNNVEAPWPTASGMGAPAVIVGNQLGGNIGRDAGVVARGLRFASQDIDETLASNHTTMDAKL